MLFLALAAKHHTGEQQPLHISSGNPNDAEDDMSGNGDSTDGSCEESSVIDLGQPLESLEVRTTKKRFLDNFAELLAWEKDASMISCCAMIESQTDVKVYVTRNKGFRKADMAQLKEGQPPKDAKFFSDLTTMTLDMQKGKI